MPALEDLTIGRDVDQTEVIGQVREQLGWQDPGYRRRNGKYRHCQYLPDVSRSLTVGGMHTCCAWGDGP